MELVQRSLSALPVLPKRVDTFGFALSVGAVRSLRLALLFLLLFVAAGSSTYAQAGDAVKMKIEDAVVADFSLVRRIFELTNSLDGFEPQSEKEIDDWVKNAQRVRHEVLDLTKQGNEARTKFINDLKSGVEAEASPLREPVIRYFEAENGHFALIEKSQDNTTVMLFQPGSSTEEQMRGVDALCELNEALLKSHQHLVKCQGDLLEQANAQGLELSRVWDPAEQKSMLESSEAMKNLRRSLRGE